MGGGWSDKTKLILISTLVEVVVEVEVELGNKLLSYTLNLKACLEILISSSLDPLNLNQVEEIKAAVY